MYTIIASMFLEVLLLSSASFVLFFFKASSLIPCVHTNMLITIVAGNIMVYTISIFVIVILVMITVIRSTFSKAEVAEAAGGVQLSNSLASGCDLQGLTMEATPGTHVQTMHLRRTPDTGESRPTIRMRR